MDRILQGRLGPFTVADVFQFLAMAEATGRLVVEAADDRAMAYFHRGRLIYARRNRPPERLGDRLLRLGLLERRQLAGMELRAELAPAGKRIGQVLVEAGSIDQDTLRRVVRDQIRETVSDILAFRRGDFHFEAGRLPHDEDILLDVSLDVLLLEGMKRLDELARDRAPGRA
jgi:hypothetical protein